MKTIKKLFLILCLLTLSSVIPVSAAKAGSTKSPAGKSYISISNIKLSSSKLKAGDTLKYSFKITDKDVAAHFRRGGMPKLSLICS